MEAFKLQGGEANAATRKAVEDIFLAYMKATAPAKYHKLLTPDYPVRPPIEIDFQSQKKLTLLFSLAVNALYSIRTTIKACMLIMWT